MSSIYLFAPLQYWLVTPAPTYLNTKYAYKPVLTYPLSPYTLANQIDPFARLLDHIMESSQIQIPGFSTEQVNGLTAHLSAVIDSKLKAFSKRLKQQEQAKNFYLKWLEYERSMTQPVTQQVTQPAKQLAKQPAKQPAKQLAT